MLKSCIFIKISMGFSFQIILVNKSRDEELPCIEDYLPVFEVPSAFLGSLHVTIMTLQMTKLRNSAA